MHPLVNNLSEVSIIQLEKKVAELTKKYFLTTNMDVQRQISMVLESYNAELAVKRQSELEKMMAKNDKSLDKLINID